MVKLSDRLRRMAECVKPGEATADIGTDHGLLPIFLYENKRSSRLILCDINGGPLKKAEENVNRFLGEGLFVGPFSLRLGNGLSTVDPGEVQAVIIAGMGGILISDILQANIKKARSFTRLILQPRNHSPELRQWLYKRKFEIYQEFLVREGIYICEVICARPRGDLGLTEPLPKFGSTAPPASLSEFGSTAPSEPLIASESSTMSELGWNMSSDPKRALDFEISPLWIRQKDPLLEEFLSRKISVEQKIIAKIEEASSTKSREKPGSQLFYEEEPASELIYGEAPISRSIQEEEPAPELIQEEEPTAKLIREEDTAAKLIRMKKQEQARMRLKFFEELYSRLFEETAGTGRIKKE